MLKETQYYVDVEIETLTFALAAFTNSFNNVWSSVANWKWASSSEEMLRMIRSKNRLVDDDSRKRVNDGSIFRPRDVRYCKDGTDRVDGMPTCKPRSSNHVDSVLCRISSSDVEIV